MRGGKIEHFRESASGRHGETVNEFPPAIESLPQTTTASGAVGMIDPSMNRLVAWFLAAALLVAIASWGISFLYPHALRLPRGYGLRCENGTVQLRRETETDLQLDAAGIVRVVEVPIGTSSMVRFARPGLGVRLALSPWRPYSTAFFSLGGFLALPGGEQAHFGYQIDVWSVAHWTLAAPLLLLIACCAFIARRRRRDRERGLCPACGYDLRATPNRCPECGGATPSKPAFATV